MKVDPVIDTSEPLHASVIRKIFLQRKPGPVVCQYDLRYFFFILFINKVLFQDLSLLLFLFLNLFFNSHKPLLLFFLFLLLTCQLQLSEYLQVWTFFSAPFLLVFKNKGVVSVFDHVFSSRTLKCLGNLGPFFSVLQDRLKEKDVFFKCPLSLF